MAHDWDKLATEWESDQSVRNYSEQAFKELEKIINLKGKRVFDFGCGTGLLSEKIAPFAKDIVALDASEEMIEELDKKLLENVEPVVDHLSRGLVAQHPAFRGQFDCVVASSVCGFLEDFDTAAYIIYTLLEEDGVFVHWDWLASEGEDGLTEASVEKVLVKAGFDTVTVSVPFEVDTEQGPMSVVMGIGEK
ncbi:methyltransferase domain-containing protein [Vibrio hannami]|uniref:class I SAM-dependent DNA methyltransferase n=1 Tax=Vibrio hannami TaxID=2717094 RepID=UPI00240FD993|nr:methyltransferase domain-containing protein [Vibrio hannami]MDG3086000.1 methyltransferase domain-containing protein [Vibrio hannami]